MRGFRKNAFHETAIAKHNGVHAEELADYSVGDPVMTVDGFPGRVTGVLFGPYQNTETYQVTLDAGMGGGDYLSGQLTPIRQNTAARVEADLVFASIPVEAVTDHTANVDYPELEDILMVRPPNENIRLFASKTAAVNTDKMDMPDSSKEDPGENAEPENPDDDTKVDDVEDPAEGNEDPTDEADNGETNAKVGDVTPPSACSFCGHNSFSEPKTTGRGVRVACDQCGGTMTSWGGQWQPDPPNSPENHASEQWDYRSGGPGGVVQAPGANFKVTMLDVQSNMDKIEMAESLQSEAGIVQYLFNKLYENAREKYDRDQIKWWLPPAKDLGTNLQGPSQYDPHLVTPRQVSLGSVSEYDDPDWRWHFTSSWMDVQAKARKIRQENHVKIVASSNTFVTAEVKGDLATYETQLNYVPGTKKVADWACGCKWASYSWGRSPRYARFEGRLCSHALATQYEANARGIFGREVHVDENRPEWQQAHSPVVVQYDKGQGKDLTRRAVPPANMKRTFSSLLLDSDGVYPEPNLMDLTHAPIYASVQAMLDNDTDLPDVIEMVASMDVDKTDARSLIFEALLSTANGEGYPDVPTEGENGSTWTTEASKQHKKKHPTVVQPHGITYGYGLGPGWGPCGLCGGSGCNTCHGTGQVSSTDVTAPGAGGVENANDGDADDGGSAMSATSKVLRRTHIFLQGQDKPLCGAHETGEPKQVDGLFENAHDKRDYCKTCHDLLPEGETLEAHPFYHEATLVTADYSTADPMSGLDGGNNYYVPTPHSTSDNPASTGFATSQDPGDWGKSLISNDFGVQTDAALHYSGIPSPNPFEDDSEPDSQSEHHDHGGGGGIPERAVEELAASATLHESPEAALPYTDGAQEQEVDGDPLAGNSSSPHGNRTFDNTSGNIPGVELYDSLSTTATESQIIAEFQKSAGAQAMMKVAMKDFSFEEQQDLINEGKGSRARNFGDLRIAGTHYELIPSDAEDDSILWI